MHITSANRIRRSILGSIYQKSDKMQAYAFPSNPLLRHLTMRGFGISFPSQLIFSWRIGLCMNPPYKLPSTQSTGRCPRGRL